ncbi:MAG: hypothetical protein H6722_24820 [Sandaracinus sp.]|nr:hypothetical protein [Sandaracinus sp.]MCB9618757.1 hypothetical protein [Sandaracinus sp.]
MTLPANGLYRTTIPHPLVPSEIPQERLVYVGRKNDEAFVVVPHFNENNRWFWREPVTPLTDEVWARTLIALPSEGFYTLPRALDLGNGGRWLENAVVQLGYDRSGHGILFVAEKRESMADNALYFSDRGHRIDDTLLRQIRWAPILPVSETDDAVRH